MFIPFQFASKNTLKTGTAAVILVGLMLMAQSNAQHASSSAPPLPPSPVNDAPPLPNLPSRFTQVTSQGVVSPPAKKNSPSLLRKALLHEKFRSAPAVVSTNDSSQAASNQGTTAATEQSVSPNSPQAVQQIPSGESLEKIYQQNREERGHFSSSTYLLKFFGILGLLLGLFYLAIRYLAAKGVLSGKTSEPLIPFRPGNDNTSGEHPAPTRKSLFAALFSGAANKDQDTRYHQPQVISRTRLTPTKEIHVVRVGNRQLVIGSTPQQMTLLAELPVEPPKRVRSIEKSSRERQEYREKDVYKKYLTPPPPVWAKGESSIPAEEEIYLLDDYEDEFERT